MQFRLNYPDTEYSTNSLFVSMANETLAYRELHAIFSDYGLNLVLHAVEKVMSGRVKGIPFSDTLVRSGLAPSDRVLWDACISHFKLEPLETKTA